MYLMPLWITWISFVISATVGRFLGRSGALLVCITSILWSCISSCFIFYEICICQSTCYIEYMNWIHVDILDIHWGFAYDPLSASMLLVITMVSLCANIYSVEYMRSDPHNIRFFSYLSLFTFFMILLVISDNALQLFVGWEGVGICSYLLINFWYTRIQANKASILAVMTNKVGDIALILGIALLCNALRTIDFAAVNACSEYVLSVESRYGTDVCLLWDTLCTHILGVDSAELMQYYIYNSCYSMESIVSYTRVVCLLAVIAAIGKSAQAGLHIWLPEAMEGPTPVSSLIHAATMVTAGIFLLVRCSYVFMDMNTMYVYIILIGSLTAFFSSTVGLLQNDIKKVVAYSTCSQLGYMFVCCGFSAYNNSMYHLFNHAFFKALLFLTAGYIIHAMSNEQDVRKMGSMLIVSPFPYVMKLVGSLSLVGFPFLSGFYSKDRIIELCFNNYINMVDMIETYRYIIFAQIFCLLAVIFTLIYSIKLLFYVFINSYCGFKRYMTQLHFSTIYIQLPLLFLSFLSITSGYFTSDMMVGLGTTFWTKSFYVDTFTTQDQINILKSQFLLHTEYNAYIRNITVVWTIYFLVGSMLLVTFFKYFFMYSVVGSLIWIRQLFTLVCKKYLFINRIMMYPFISSVMRISYNTMYKLFDKGLIEFVGPFGITHGIKQLVMPQHILQSGLIYHYAGFFFIALMIVIHIILDVQCM